MPDEQTRNVKAYFDRLAESYERSPPWDELTERIYDELTWRYIEPYLPRDGLVLDAGGRTGKWAIPIAQRGLQVVLLDISDSPERLRKPWSLSWPYVKELHPSVPEAICSSLLGSRRKKCDCNGEVRP